MSSADCILHTPARQPLNASSLTGPYVHTAIIRCDAPGKAVPAEGPRISDNRHRQLCQRAADTLVRLIHLPLSSRVFQRGRSSSVSGRSPLQSRPKDQNTTLSGSSPCTGDLGILKLHPTARWFSCRHPPTALSCVSFDCCLCSSGRRLMHMHGNRLLPPPVPKKCCH